MVKYVAKSLLLSKGRYITIRYQLLNHITYAADVKYLVITCYI